MNASDPLNLFLDRQRSQGQLESSGEFTVALEKARAKLREYQLADPSFYLVKVLQAAVRAGTQAVDVIFRNDLVQLSFELDATEELVFERIPDGLIGIQGLPDGAVRHLCVGLNSSLVTNPTEVCWGEWEERRGRLLTIVEKGFQIASKVPPPDLLRPRSKKRLLVFRLRTRPTYGLLRRTTREHASFLRRCAYAPVDLSLDGRPTRPGWRQPEPAEWHLELSGPYYLVQRYRLGPGARFPPIDLSNRNSYGNDYLRKLSFFSTGLGRQPPFAYQVSGDRSYLGGSHLECDLATSLPLSLEGPSALILMKDGALLEPVVVGGGGALTVAVDRDIKVDISEFSPLQNEELMGWREVAQQEWRAMKALLKDCPELPVGGVRMADNVDAGKALVSLLGGTPGTRNTLIKLVKERLDRVDWPGMRPQAPHRSSQP